MQQDYQWSEFSYDFLQNFHQDSKQDSKNARKKSDSQHNMMSHFLESIYKNLLQYLQNLMHNAIAQPMRIHYLKAFRFHIFGRIQGVGLRPFVMNLATKLQIHGFVKNMSSCVEIVFIIQDSRIESSLHNNDCNETLQSYQEIMQKIPHSLALESKKLTLLEQEFLQQITLFFTHFFYVCNDKVINREIYSDETNSKDSIPDDLPHLLYGIFLPKNIMIQSIRTQIIFETNSLQDSKNPIPQQSNIAEKSEITAICSKKYHDFSIEKSSLSYTNSLQIQLPLDYGICQDCLEDIRNEDSRFHQYCFSTCVNCGARYSMIKALPYDRANTTMNDFAMCKACLSDYKNLNSRRFHTEPMSCNECKIEVIGFYYTAYSKAEKLQNHAFFAKYPNINPLQAKKICFNTNALKAMATALQHNKIVLFKGLGGFAFLANARHTQTLQTLRRIKSRPTKPFAIMAKYQTLQKLALFSNDMQTMLHSPQSPIILTLKSQSYNLSHEVCNLATIGVMIPYSAMLYLLFEYLDDDFAMVYTSANNKGDMIASSLDELNLNKILESYLQDNTKQELFVLSYQREIQHRLDDSIVLGIDFSSNTNTTISQTHSHTTQENLTFNNQTIKENQAQKSCDYTTHSNTNKQESQQMAMSSNILESPLRTMRLSRGFTPLALQFAHLKIPSLSVGFGAMQKSSFAFGLHSNVVISPYMGDLFSAKNVSNFRKNFDFFCSLYGMPEVFITDKHTQYASTQIAHEIAKERNIEIFQIGHHHAHFNALLLESQLQSAVGVIFDGSGLGEDGSIWGGEFVFGNFKEIKRFLSFKPFRILGGEKHIKDSMRLCLSYAMCNDIPIILEFLERFYTQSEWNLLHTMQKMGLNSPLTSSVGRLFDIAGFILGLKEIDYEGQSGEIIATLALQQSMQQEISQNRESIAKNTAKSHKTSQGFYTSYESLGLCSFPLTTNSYKNPLFTQNLHISNHSSYHNKNQFSEKTHTIAYNTTQSHATKHNSKQPTNTHYITTTNSYFAKSLATNASLYKKSIHHKNLSDNAKRQDSKFTLNSAIFNLDSIAYSLRESAFNPYPFCIENAQIDMKECFIEMFQDSLNHKDKSLIALRFIDTLAFCVLESLQSIHADYAVFGGGVFANFVLCARLQKLLNKHKITCFFPKLPCNDYSISLGELAFVSKS